MAADGLKAPPPGRAARPEFGFHLRRMLIEWWGVLVAITLAVAAMGMVAPPVRVDNLFYDLLQRLQPPRPDSRLLIVAIDDDSLRALGRWPWDRSLHAQLIDRLTADGVGVIGYDVLFPDREAGAADPLLAAAIRRSGRVVLPSSVEIPGPDGAPALRVPPAEPLRAAAAAVGEVGLRPDRDGVVRGIDRLADGQGHPDRHFAVLVAALAAGGSAPAQPVAATAPVVVQSRDLVRFAGPAGSYSRIGFADLVEGRVPASLVRGRVVLVGATAAGLGDRFSTPMSGTRSTMPGVEVNANYVDNLLQQRLIHPVRPMLWLLFSVLPVWLLMLSLRVLGPGINLWLGLLLSLAVLLATLLSFRLFHLWLPPALALVALWLVYPLWGWRRLDLASRYLLAELRGFRAEGTIIPRTRANLSGDPVQRQIALMHEAIRDVRDLRRFVTQSLESLPDAAVVADPGLRVAIANRAADALFDGRIRGPLVGQTLADLLASLDRDSRLPDTRAATLLQQMAGFRPGNSWPGPGAGHELHLADGRSVELRVAYFTDTEGALLGWIARFADITAIRASERRREDTLRLLTHDMRAPQASILALLELEGRQLPQELTARLAHYARQTLSLADDFVQLERAKGGRYQISEFNLADALLDAVDDLWPLADAAGIRVDAVGADSDLPVTGDRALLTRAIANLVGNALKYSPVGSHVTASARPLGGEVCCEIRDEGRGIAADDLPKLFEAFSRLGGDEGRTLAPGGAGLGLAFVKAVVERHGGTVSVASVPGKGSSFSFRLPRAGG